MPFLTYDTDLDLSEYESVLAKIIEIIDVLVSVSNNSGVDTSATLLGEIPALLSGEALLTQTFTANKESIIPLTIALRNMCDQIKSLERANTISAKTRADYYSEGEIDYAKIKGYYEYLDGVYMTLIEAAS